MGRASERVEGKSITLPIESILLLLLYARKDKPIINRTVLYKELFLTYMEVLPKYSELVSFVVPHFIPYKYGPYSENIGEVLLNLLSAGYIDVRGRAKGRHELFLMTEAGKRYVETLVKKYPELSRVLNELSEMRIAWDELGRDGILKYVYQNYPEYTTKSLVKEKYGGVSWGSTFRE